MEEKKSNDIVNFYDACTDLQKAKLILADAKIGKILKTIMESADLFATVGECLINFSYEAEFRKAQIKKDAQTLYFKLPSEKNKLIALVFNILNDCDNHKLDLHAFIKDFFINDEGDMAYGFLNFVHKVVFPFRDALCSLFVGEEIEDEKEEEPQQIERVIQTEATEEPSDLLGEFYHDITNILLQIKETISFDYKVKQDRRDEINITIDAMLESMDMGNLKMMNALVIGLYYLLKSIKSVRFYRDELQDRLCEFYAELQK